MGELWQQTKADIEQGIETGSQWLEGKKVKAAEMQRRNAQAQSAASRQKTSGFMDYVDAINSARQSTINMLMDPVATAENLAVLAWDLGNLATDFTGRGGVTEGSRTRNVARAIGLFQGAQHFVYGSGPERVEMVTELVSGAILTGAVSGGVGAIARVGVENLSVAALKSTAQIAATRVGTFARSARESRYISEYSEVAEIKLSMEGLGNNADRVTSSVLPNKGIGLTTRLNRSQIRNYLANIHSIPREQLIQDLGAVGFKLKGESPHGLFKTFEDKTGNTRVKLHPPDPETDYSHIHLYDKKRNSLTQSLIKAPHDSPEVHIEIEPIQKELEWRLK